MKTNIKDVIRKIDDLFANFNRDSNKFTVDYDEKKDGIYCNYTPFANHPGYAVSDVLLNVCDTSVKELQELKDHLAKQHIYSKDNCEWFAEWGFKDA